MKTVFLSIYDGDTEKNILHTGVVEQLVRAGLRVVLLIRGAGRIDHYKQAFETTQVRVELLPSAGSRAENVWYFIGWNIIPTRAVRVRQIRGKENNTIVTYTAGLIVWALGHLRVVREFFRALYMRENDSYAAELFQQYTPDVLFSPGMFSPEDCRLLRAAKKRGVKTVTMGKSWDVLTTKAFTRVKADKLLVFNQFNKDEAIAYGDYDADRVAITGFPQFDIYTDSSQLLSRDAFCARIGADPTKHLVVFGVPGDWKSPHSKSILARLDKAVESGELLNVQIIARLHPKYSDTSEGMDARHIIFDRPGKHFASQKEFGIDGGVGQTYQWRFGKDDIQHLFNTLHHCDVVINTDSTLTLDAAAVDTPAIIIGYDGDSVLPYKQSIAFTYEREHYQNVVQTGAAPLIRSHDELISTIKRFIDEPEYLRAERNALREKMLFKTDGHSAERVALEIASMLS